MHMHHYYNDSGTAHQEVLCDLVLVDAILRRNAGATVTLHVKDAPVFVSDVTEKEPWEGDDGAAPPICNRETMDFHRRSLKSTAKYGGFKPMTSWSSAVCVHVEAFKW